MYMFTRVNEFLVLLEVKKEGEKKKAYFLLSFSPCNFLLEAALGQLFVLLSLVHDISYDTAS